jgi:predicted peptidase
MTRIAVLGAIAAMTGCGTLAAQEVTFSWGPPYTDAQGQVLPYRLIKPENYDPNQKYPLVLFFHGAGERGDDNQAQLKNAVDVFASEEIRRKYPAFVVVPQCPSGQRWVEMDWGADSGVQPAEPSPAMRMSRELIAELQKEFSIDPRRIYATGISMGGYGVWDALTRYPGLFAAGAAVCGGGDESKAGAIGATPVWAFHAEDDPVVKVSRSRNMVKALQDAGGTVRYTEYPADKKLGHVSWNEAFNDPGLLPWLFDQTLPETAATSPGKDPQ